MFPTPIQAQAWPITLKGSDIMAIAKTGSWKTLGYFVPAFILLRHCRNSPWNGPIVLLVALTREVTTQIQDEVLNMSSNFPGWSYYLNTR